MEPDERFRHQSKRFWAYVRAISEQWGYTARGSARVKGLTPSDLIETLVALDLPFYDIAGTSGLTHTGMQIVEYFQYRANILNNWVESQLMDLDEARRIFEELQSDLLPQCPLPMNKQSGDKKGPAYFTCIINMLIESAIQGHQCDYDPRELTKVTTDRSLVRTLARHVDGAFPSAIDPVAIWEVKEYYHTTTFGSRVADGIYETLLDGMELEDLAASEDIDIKHYMFVDSRQTWWESGRSYLCRIVDMLNMGYVDEVLFGREVVDRIPTIAGEWLAELTNKPR